MILAVLQARYSSSRLPGKVLKPILGKPMLQHQIERVKRAKKIDELVVATSSDPSDDAIAKLCEEQGILCFRGSLDDVLDRVYQAAKPYSPDHVVRLTGDCPLSDPEIIDQVIEFHLRQGADYSSNAIRPVHPDGLDVEVCRFSVLTEAWKEAKLPSQREHVMPFIHGQPARFKIAHFESAVDHSEERWTVDTAADFELVTAIYGALYPSNPAFGMQDVLKFLKDRPELADLNRQSKRNEGFQVSLQKDKSQSRYSASQQMLERALKTIPLGSQTFSKSKTQYPAGVSPHFIQKAKGSRVWDVDGNEYIDFVNSLCAVNLGYGDPDVTAAVKSQLDEGVIFSLPHPIEHLVAEKIVEMVPCAEMVRFGKNGSDATSGAVRLARAYTNRDHVAICGYHGWQDWYIGLTARNRGVPKSTQELTHAFTYNNLDSLRKIFKDRPGQIAAVILEPMNVAKPEPGFLEGVKEITHQGGALLVFDETITGFRYANGGAQELFGVVPDLATFGKGMANGYPVSAVAGKAEYMKLMEEIFFSFTFGGETLSLAAALATMKKLQKEPVVKQMNLQGGKILKGVQELLAKNEIGGFLECTGNPTWSFMLFKDGPKYSSWQVKTLFLQEVFARGILTVGTHNLSYAHTDADVARLLGVYEEVFPILKKAVTGGELEKLLHCKPLEPLFKLR